MAKLVMIVGESGTGKSTSLRNLPAEKTAIINVSGKPMPFKTNKELGIYSTDDYGKIQAALSKTDREIIVIDDATYLMTNEFMRNAKVTGFQKFTDMALNFDNLIRFAASLPENKTVYFLGHIERSDDGREHFKTIGKMLDNYVTVEGRFTIVLKTVVKDGHYYFSTMNSGNDTVKSPIGMFDSDLIENDLAEVDKAIRAYYEM